MATNVIMPALEMAQESGKIIRWLKSEGATVTKGEPLMEIETDKVTVEIEAPASGILTNITAREGDVVPVGQTIAVILAPDEQSAPSASPVARKIAAEHGVDLARVKPSGGRIEKADVLAYLGTTDAQRPQTVAPRPIAASPKARRLAQERGIDLATLRGTGPAGAILAADVPTASISNLQPPISNTWRVMAERMVQSWTTAPHFFLTREVNASRLVTWRERVNARAAEKITFTDLLVKIVATALRQHPRLNAAWRDGALVLHDDINIGIAVAIEEGLVVPVIHRADTLTLAQIAARRAEVVARAQAGKLRLDDVQGGTFTLSNLGMYGVDAFHAIVNPPQAAILAVGRIAERVVAVNGQPSVQPMLTLTLSCDHRVVDGARGAQFLGSIAEFIEEPLELLLLR